MAITAPTSGGLLSYSSMMLCLSETAIEARGRRVVRVFVSLRMETVLCFVEKEVRQKEQRPNKRTEVANHPQKQSGCTTGNPGGHTCARSSGLDTGAWGGPYTVMCLHFFSKVFSKVSHTFIGMNLLHPQKRII